ncbi:hypothetical protein IFT80_19955 [Pseudomonas sp. CFBP 8771]|uniref:hypothetical protein n=1 Tax=Pseudomonas sp. CFBP 8771 TaxID=2775285 RepID=UPI001781B242|nr:hypothetical protein [Pseudomonas sp. CFBP 8771]MBD8604918.1 hypothetical protein [Pseudomonas sp. CFBP 8771]
MPVASPNTLAPVPAMIGSGEMRDVVHDMDWSRTALGDYCSWSASLRTSLSLVLNTKGIAALYWGPQQWLLYNDAYGLSLFERIHPDDLAHTQQGASLSADGHAYARFDNRYRPSSE